MEENLNLSKNRVNAQNGVPFLEKPVIKRTSSHDQFFKYAFSIPGVINRFLEWILPREMLEQIDLSEITREDSSFFDENLSSACADLLFRVPVNAKTETGTSVKVPGYIFILMEHKSYDDFNTIFQEVRYIIRIWERERKNAKTKGKRKLPFVLPITFYHSIYPFSGPQDLTDLVENVPGFEEYLPSWKMCLVDLKSIPNSEIPDDWVLNLILSVLKLIIADVTRKQFIEEWYKAAKHQDEPGAKELLESSLYYYFQNTQEELTAEIMNEVETMSSVISVESPVPYFRLYGDKMRAEGEERGIAIGEERGIAIGEERGIAIGEKRGIAIGEERGLAVGKAEEKAQIAIKLFGEGQSVDFIVKITGLSAEEIEKLTAGKP